MFKYIKLSNNQMYENVNFNIETHRIDINCVFRVFRRLSNLLDTYKLLILGVPL